MSHSLVSPRCAKPSQAAKPTCNTCLCPDVSANIFREGEQGLRFGIPPDSAALHYSHRRKAEGFRQGKFPGCVGGM